MFLFNCVPISKVSLTDLGGWEHTFYKKATSRQQLGRLSKNEIEWITNRKSPDRNEYTHMKISAK